MRTLAWLLSTAALVVGFPSRADADAVERMNLEKLRATHLKVESLQKELHKVTLPSGFDDVRALLHVHSGFSHDSRGSIQEIVGAAKKAGVRVIMFTEHPNKFSDYVNEGHRGMLDGVLLIPGAETEGFLAYPNQSIQKQTSMGPQGFADLVHGTGGLLFLCHLEERMDWDINHLTGSEIYNVHADFKDERRFMTSFLSPLALMGMIPAVKQYPQEMFAILQDYPADYLRRWDELCLTRRLTGVAANDAHHNQGYRALLTQDGKLQMEDALGKKLAQLDPEKIPLLKPLLSGKQPGEAIFELDLDPYERAFRYVSTHLLLSKLDEPTVRETLKDGRAYVAFDWIADPTGFVFRADRGDMTWPMGSEVHGAKGVRLRAETPLDGTLKLIRNGTKIQEVTGSTLDVTVDEPGNYRVEAWQALAGEPRIWILSNPIYVRAE